LNYIADVALKNNDQFNGIVEIVKGSRDKKELDEDTFTKLNVVRKVKKRYPFYYGCFPQTLAGDGDALDLIIITRKRLNELDIIPLDICGIILTIDEGFEDDKVIAIPYGELFSEKDLKKELSRVLRFLLSYKGKYQKNTTTDKTFYDSELALKKINIAHTTYVKSKKNKTSLVVREG